MTDGWSVHGQWSKRAGVSPHQRQPRASGQVLPPRRCNSRRRAAWNTGSVAARDGEAAGGARIFRRAAGQGKPTAPDNASIGEAAAAVVASRAEPSLLQGFFVTLEPGAKGAMNPFEELLFLWFVWFDLLGDSHRGGGGGAMMVPPLPQPPPPPPPAEEASAPGAGKEICSVSAMSPFSPLPRFTGGGVSSSLGRLDMFKATTAALDGALSCWSKMPEIEGTSISGICGFLSKAASPRPSSARRNLTRGKRMGGVGTLLIYLIRSYRNSVCTSCSVNLLMLRGEVTFPQKSAVPLKNLLVHKDCVSYCIIFYFVERLLCTRFLHFSVTRRLRQARLNKFNDTIPRHTQHGMAR